jgi:hypothetical protein
MEPEGSLPHSQESAVFICQLCKFSTSIHDTQIPLYAVTFIWSILAMGQIMQDRFASRGRQFRS